MTSAPQEQTPAVSPEVLQENIDTPETNIYPVIRTAFLVICVVLVACVTLFLIYQNGKSIYETGI